MTEFTKKVLSSLICHSDSPKFRHATLLIVCLCIVFALLVGCRSAVSVESLCRITPEELGTMDEEDVRQWFDKELGISNPIVREEGNQKGYIWLSGDETGGIFLREGHVHRIEIIRTGPTIEQVVNKLGSPEMIKPELAFGNNAEDITAFFTLAYPKNGISVQAVKKLSEDETSPVNNKWNVSLNRNMPIEYVTCYAPQDSLETVQADVFFRSAPELETELNAYIPWPGFDSLISISLRRNN